MLARGSLGEIAEMRANYSVRTLPTAASPNRTSLTLLLGFGAFPESAIVGVGKIK